MAVTDFRVELVDRADIAAFIERWHYSGSINGCISDYCFALYDGETMIGAMFYGRMAMANQWKRFAAKANDVVELRRLCCVDSAPKNTESFFIGTTLRWLKKNTAIKTVVSYADAEYGHAGVIYQASNFKLDGFRKGAKVIVFNGRKYHDKAIRTKYLGQLKPFAKRLADAIVTGEAKFQETAGKFCYVYQLRK